MDEQAVMGALVQAGGYAILCGLLIWRFGQAIDRLTEVIRENTAALAELRGALAGGGAN